MTFSDASRAAGNGIDAVYTWVDGHDPEFRAQVQHDSQLQPRDGREAGDGFDDQRFFDNDELRYSLRSLERYAPWIRRVHLVTNGQVPAWLDATHERLAVVSHRDLCADPDHLPTFNSNAIEWMLGRIPGLSTRFLYFNDDVFPGRPISLDDFITPAGGQKIYLDPWDMPGPGESASWGQHLVHTQALLDCRFEPRSHRRSVAHVPLKSLARLLAVAAIRPTFSYGGSCEAPAVGCSTTVFRSPQRSRRSEPADRFSLDTPAGSTMIESLGCPRANHCASCSLPARRLDT